MQTAYNLINLPRQTRQALSLEEGAGEAHGTPVNLVDPDGRKIYFADGVPEWFKERFAATIQYMNEKGTSWIFKKLQDSDNTYKINYIDDDNIMYDPEKNNILES